MSSNVTNAELILLKRQRLDAMRRLQTARSADPQVAYRPHSKQNAFHRSAAKLRMVRAGNRFGKSHMGANEDLAWCRGERVWYAEGDPARRAGLPQRPTKGVILTTDWDVVNDVWTNDRGDRPGKLWALAPQGFFKSKTRNPNGVIDSMLCATGSTIKFDTVRSFMNNPQSAESRDFDWIHVDEPCPEAMFKGYARGLMDRGGSAWFTLTPLSEFWINDLFFPEGEVRSDVWSIDGTTFDNPHLTREAIAAFEALLTDDEKQCRLYGIPLHLVGLVYKEFSAERHVLREVPIGWTNWITPPADWVTYFHIDYHPRTPHAVLYCAVGPLGHRIYYYDQFKHCTTKELALLVRGVLSQKRCGLGRIDPLAFIDDPITGSNAAAELARYGLYVERATKALAQGILRVKQSLKEGSIWFTPEVRRTLWEIKRYAWDDEKNEPVDADDHMMENLYRMELMEPRWFDGVGSAPIDEIEICRPELSLSELAFNLD